MCAICDKAAGDTKSTGQGPTADAWARADAAIRAWRSANPALDFDNVLDEVAAWAKHCDETAN